MLYLLFYFASSYTLFQVSGKLFRLVVPSLNSTTGLESGSQQQAVL